MLKKRTEEQLIAENNELKLRLSEAEETLNAIRTGAVDAIVVSGSGTEKIFSLISAETPYRLLIEEMKEGAVTLSEDGIILYCNHSFEDMVSIPMQQIVGSRFNRFLGNKEQRKNFYNVLFANPLERISDDIVYYTCNNVCRYLHLSYCPIPSGSIGRMCIIVSDITELKKYQNDLQALVYERTEELENANRMLKKINSTKDKLFSIIAHDLRAPFTALLGFSELLNSNMKNNDVGYFEMIVNNIQLAVKSAYELTENLLIWANTQRKTIHFNPEITNLSEILKEILQDLKTTAHAKNISLNFVRSEKLMAFTDVNMFKIILRNLIMNAIKFTHQGGRISIRASLRKDFVEISVSDNGVGMTKEQMDDLFNIEVTKTSSGTAHEKGTGLGLLICKEFIDMHQGKLSIESTLGKGSSFTVVFPQPQEVYNKMKIKQH